MSNPTIKDYAVQIVDRTCRWCQAKLNNKMHGYKHEGGYPVAGFEMPQWLYVVCPKCDYQWSLRKLGIRQLDQGKEVKP